MTDQPDNPMLVYLHRIEENLAGVHRRIDRLELRVERIERRLDLADTTH
ncbi:MULTISPECIES: hypothetical protein [unclassified Methylobacterium]|nr:MULTISPECIES: hypothetical protein [unclassified Methylobacterium]